MAPLFFFAQEAVAKWSEYVHARARDFFAGTQQLEEAETAPPRPCGGRCVASGGKPFENHRKTMGK